MENVGKQGIVATLRSEYIRIAPHFYLDDKDMKRAAECFNREAGRK